MQRLFNKGMDVDTHHSEIIIVGGSLAGLSLALACATRGVPVRVLERSVGRVIGGDSLSVDLELLARTVRHDPRAQPQLPVVPAYRELTTWPALYTWLRDRVLNTASITLEEGMQVVSVANDGHHARVWLADSTSRTAPAVIGADGYRSVVRQAVAPEQPLAHYAGYLVWRGLVEEQVLSRPVRWPSNGGLWIDFERGYRLVAAVLPGRDGSVEPGRRQVTFAWFDVHQQALLLSTGCLDAAGQVIGTLGRDKIDTATREQLAALAVQVWPQPWQEAVIAGLRSVDALSGAPIAEYLPPRLANGALGLVGDAAHVLSPMTGRGFLTGVEDAGLLAGLLASKDSSETLAQVLARYETQRLPFIRGLVSHSRRISEKYRHFGGA